MWLKRLSGEVLEWDLDAPSLRIRFRKGWEGPRAREMAVTFALDPYAMLTSAERRTLEWSELAVGQPVTLTYVTGIGGQPIAKAVTVRTTEGEMERHERH